MPTDFVVQLSLLAKFFFSSKLMQILDFFMNLLGLIFFSFLNSTCLISINISFEIDYL